MATRTIPKGFHTITPNIIVEDAEQAVKFLEAAFGFVEKFRLTMADGKLTHVEMQLGDSIVNLGQSMEGWPAHGLVAQIYVDDSEALFKRAIDAGAKEIMPMTDMFFGTREGRVADPWGNVWTIATLKEEIDPTEMQRRAKPNG